MDFDIILTNTIINSIVFCLQFFFILFFGILIPLRTVGIVFTWFKRLFKFGG